MAGLVRGAVAPLILFAALALPATASAWTVTVKVHGAGKVEEVLNRFGEEKHQLDCTVSPSGVIDATVTECVGGSATALWNSGNIVKLKASVPADAFNRGWRFSHWVDGTASKQINCDPQDAIGVHTSTECEFQIFDNLYVDLVFDDVQGPQDTAVTSGPANGSVTNQTAATFGFNSPSEGDAKFECKLDRPGLPGTFAACGGPLDKAESYSGLTTNGSYTFSVRSRDVSAGQLVSGNVGSTATRTWTIDTTPPAVALTGFPPAASNDMSPAFAFTTGEAGSTFECALDAGGFSSCGSPREYGGPLDDGEHTFRVRAYDSLGNGPGPVTTRVWTVDTVAPDTSLLDAPAEGSTSDTGAATFSFSSADAGAGLQCRLDGETFVACTSPYSRNDITNGDRTFEVRAVDAAGNVDATPATRTWRVNSLDADRDGHNRPQDCADSDPAINPAAVDVPDDGVDQDCDGADEVNLDRDADGIPRPADCDDGNGAIRPGAVDLPEDGVDQDCAGGDAAWRMPTSSLSYRFGAAGTRTRVLKLALGRVPDGGTVTVLCAGGERRGCTWARRGVKVSAGGDAKALPLVRLLRLRAGAVLEVRVAAPGLATKVSRFTIRKPPRGPVLRSGCLKPGGSTLATCA